MAKSEEGQDWLKDEFGELIDELQLNDWQKRFMRSRWLDQLAWVESKAGQTQFRYYALRITAIIGGVIVPALVGLNFGNDYDQRVRGAAFVLGLMVAISVAVEEFFHYGERWRHYRSTAEVLKSEGWQLFQLSGRYGKYSSHAAAYREFADQVERILTAEVSKFVTEVAVEKKSTDANTEAS